VIKAAPTVVTAEIGSPWDFYRVFWPQHGLAIPEALMSPKIYVSAGSSVIVPIKVSNPTGTFAKIRVALESKLPDGWTAKKFEGEFELLAGETRVLNISIATPDKPSNDWTPVRFSVTAGDKRIGDVSLGVQLQPFALPQG
jgi:hypothetical protein